VSDPSEAALSQALIDCLREPRRSNGRDASARLDERVIADRLLRLYMELAPKLDLAIGDATDVGIVVEARMV
jgi:hypothetical protein